MNGVSMAGDVRGRLSFGHLVDPKRAAGEDRDLLAIFANTVTAADALTAAVLRASIEECLVNGTKKVDYMPPVDPGVDQTLENLLGPLPEICTPIRDGRPAPPRDRHAIVPATPIRDEEGLELAALAIKAIAGHLRLSQREWEMAVAAAVAFGTNGLTHASHSPCGVVICAGIEPRSAAIVVAAADLGGGSDINLRDAIERSRAELGGLAQLSMIAERKELQIALHLAAGTEEASLRNRWQFEVRSNVPGWCAAMEILRT